jgi:hypothetical protein
MRFAFNTPDSEVCRFSARNQQFLAGNQWLANIAFTVGSQAGTFAVQTPPWKGSSVNLLPVRSTVVVLPQI